jgi:GNAT superfamily N-acetyltransferase
MRQATRADVAGIQRVRGAVRENRLESRVITDDEVIEAIEVNGRGWVVKVDDEIVAFAIGDARDGNIWALFVDPAHERCGHGRRLHDVMIAWLAAKGLRELWLTTTPGTRAEGFYDRAGWRRDGITTSGEVRFVRTVA